MTELPEWARPKKNNIKSLGKAYGKNIKTRQDIFFVLHWLSFLPAIYIIFFVVTIIYVLLLSFYCVHQFFFNETLLYRDTKC